MRKTIAASVLVLLTAISGPSAAEPTEDDWRVTTGAIFMSVGVAAIAIGATIGTVAAVKYGDLECPNDVCAPEVFEEAEDYNALREPSGLTIALGGVLSAVGGAFLYAAFTDPGDDLAIDVGPTHLGVRGRF